MTGCPQFWRTTDDVEPVTDQGEITKVFKNKKKPTVEVGWDEVQELIDKGKEEISVVELHDRKWNKDCEGAWRMDISIEN